MGLARHLRRDATSGISPVHLIEDLWRFWQRGHRGRVISWPRHQLPLYDTLLRRLKACGTCRFVSLPAYVALARVAPNEIGIVLRHDVDAGDARSTAALCGIETRLDLRSSVHILVDDALYPAKSMASLARELHAGGFDVGLHTQAWMHRSYRAALGADLARFEDLMLFSPRTLTLHGTWPRTTADLVRRRRFVRELPALLAGTSLVGYDNEFDWVSEDSNVNGRPAPLYESFMRPEQQCYLGGVALVLTHDAHWMPGT